MPETRPATRWSGAFGDPIGSREDIQNTTQWFVRPTDEHESVYPRTRVLVGGKGSGKTLLLRILHSQAREDHSRYVPKQLVNAPPPTTKIIRFCESVTSGSLSDAWDRVWRSAILRSIASHLFCVPDLSNQFSATDLDKLRKNYAEILPNYNEARNIYVELGDLLDIQDQHSALLKRLQDPKWDDLETLFDRVLSTMPPIYFFVDGIDEFYEQAPAHWMRCQRGLFDRTIAYMRRPVFGERLHLVISIRDSVYYSALRSEHRTRYLDERIVRLHWDSGRLNELLAKKVARLNKAHIGRPKASTPAERWLGIRTIWNDRRGCNEPVYEYLRRHLRPAPRDFVVLGNEICERMHSSPNETQSEIEKIVRESVARTATHIGLESLNICAAQIAADMLPSHAAIHGFEEIYVATQEYRRSIVDHLSDLLKKNLPGDRFTAADLKDFDKAARTAFQWDVDVPSGLWQSGLLGFVDPGDGSERHRFWFTTGAQTATLPRDVREYVLHPSLIDALAINSLGETPVIPEL